jgi:hypothetical protein
MLNRIWGFNRGRHASCSGHHYHVLMTGWRCCGCKHKVSSKKAEPTSTAACRRPDAIVAATKSARRDLVLEELGYRTALQDEQTIRINKSRLRLIPDPDMKKPRNSGSHINA